MAWVMMMMLPFSWLYDYFSRRSRVEYFVTATAIDGFLFDYQILRVRCALCSVRGAPCCIVLCYPCAVPCFLSIRPHLIFVPWIRNACIIIQSEIQQQIRAHSSTLSSHTIDCLGENFCCCGVVYGMLILMLQSSILAQDNHQ